MKMRICRSLWAGVAVASALALGTSARADLVLTLQEDSGTVVTVDVPANTGPAIFSGDINHSGAVLVGDFTILISVGTSNSPGGSSALVSQGSISITNNTTSSLELKVNVSAQGFTSPNSPPPLTVLDTFAGTLVNGSVTGTFKGTADATNALFGTGFTNSGLNLSYSASGFSQSISQNGSASAAFSPNGSTYSLSSFTDLTLGGGSVLTGHLGNEQTVPTPEPASLAMAFSGLGLLGGAGWLRRRSRQA
jgi:hypothetical protein